MKFHPWLFHISILGLGHALSSDEREKKNKLEMEKVYLPILNPGVLSKNLAKEI